MAAVRIGTCSWADEALSKHWYPKGVPAGERLAYYAQHFDTVEVDSTYYRLPAEPMVAKWAERTPDDFVMPKGSASSLIVALPAPSRSSTARRFGSARATKALSTLTGC